MITTVQYVDESGKEIRRYEDDRLDGFSVAPGAELIFHGLPYIVAGARTEGSVYVVTLRSGGGKLKEKSDAN